MTPAESPLSRLAAFLTSSFRLGRAFGSEVRVYGAALILALLVGQSLPLFGMLGWWDRLVQLLLLTLALYSTVWIHEMGHVAAGWRWGIQTPLITLSPLGGLAHMQQPAPHPRAEIAISAAGPLTHLLGLAVCYPLMRLVGGAAFTLASAGGAGGEWSLQLEPVPFLLSTLVDLHLALLAFNLLPLYPLDGGRILRGILALRMHGGRATLWAARVGFVGAIALGLVGLLGVRGVGGGLLVAMAVSNALACQRALMEARYGDGPYGPALAPWEGDGESWRLGAADREEGKAPPQVRVRRPSRRRAERRAHPEVPSAEEVDRLLDRVREVGLAGLSEAERSSLQRAAEARRAGR